MVAPEVASAGVRPVSAPPVGLYVHIPFCVSICPYCDFVVYAGSSARGPTNRLDAFLAALETAAGEAGRAPLGAAFRTAVHGRAFAVRRTGRVCVDAGRPG